MDTDRFVPSSRGRTLIVRLSAFCILFATIAGGQCPTQDLQQMDGDSSNGELFPIDLTLGRDGPLFVNFSQCPVEANAVTGSGFTEVFTTPSVNPDTISATVSAPKSTDSTATLGSCGLIGRYVMLPDGNGATSRTGTLSGTLVIRSTQVGGTARNYLFMPDVTLNLVNTDTADIQGVLGNFVIEYCSIETFCTNLLPDDGAGTGTETHSFEFPDITFEAGREYILGVGINGSITSSSGIPDIGGNVEILVNLEDVQLTFQ